MKIVVAGGSGFLGSALLAKLTATGHTVILLTRNPHAQARTIPDTVQKVQWDAKTIGDWAKSIDGADAVVNLTGESIGGKRWSKTQKEILISSRVDSTKAIVEAIRQANTKPKVLVNQSAVGYYGNVPDGNVEENHPPGNDFLAEICQRWEEEARKAEALGVRVVIPRTGVVLSKHGGALPRMLLPFNLFIGGPLGTGRQWFPWIHLEDEINALAFVLNNEKLSGPVNLAAPESATMEQFCTLLGKAMHRPSWAPVPGFALKILLGEMAGPLLLGGQKVDPTKLQQGGYRFKYPKLDEALRDVLAG
ncbi:MAG: TIGR01777 family oxidoreductase [Ignavibacteriae bacterium]|nr:TIGR01777 family oxidoreductase [Ignavibacteriota bacterium]